MNDCIEREAVWNALNEIGGCGAEADSWADGWDKAINAAIRIVEKLPTADVAPVVRCKDCVLHENCSLEDTFAFAMINAENAFCCVGEMKENENG